MVLTLTILSFSLLNWKLALDLGLPPLIEVNSQGRLLLSLRQRPVNVTIKASFIWRNSVL